MAALLLFLAQLHPHFMELTGGLQLYLERPLIYADGSIGRIPITMVDLSAAPDASRTGLLACQCRQARRPVPQVRRDGLLSVRSLENLADLLKQ
jgi:hypothetical protein